MCRLLVVADMVMTAKAEKTHGEKDIKTHHNKLIIEAFTCLKLGYYHI